MRIWLRRPISRSEKPKASACRRQLTLEGLEDRLLLTTSPPSIANFDLNPLGSRAVLGSLNPAMSLASARTSSSSVRIDMSAPTAAGARFEGTAATFGLNDLYAAFGYFVVASQVQAQIDWGDSSQSAGAITTDDGIHFAVSGSHVYSTSGVYLIRTTLFYNSSTPVVGGGGGVSGGSGVPTTAVEDSLAYEVLRYVATFRSLEFPGGGQTDNANAGSSTNNPGFVPWMRLPDSTLTASRHPLETANPDFDTIASKLASSHEPRLPVPMASTGSGPSTIKVELSPPMVIWIADPAVPPPVSVSSPALTSREARVARGSDRLISSGAEKGSESSHGPRNGPNTQLVQPSGRHANSATLSIQATEVAEKRMIGLESAEDPEGAPHQWQRELLLVLIVLFAMPHTLR
jgi:hypothetical protein